MPDPLISRRAWLAACAAPALAVAPLRGFAQASWPSKPLRLVVPFAPGGSSEIVARAVAGEMAKTIGQNVFVDIREPEFLHECEEGRGFGSGDG